MTDLLDLTAELVDIPSVSLDEGRIADVIEARLRTAPWLEVTRLGDNVVARTALGSEHRLVVAGHTDTVPVNDNARARIEGDTLWGLGSSDMKSGLAVMLDVALGVDDPAVDVTWIFYVAEEIAAEHNGLKHLFEQAPELVAGDAAILGEPTCGAIEAGCQGTMRAEVTMTGERAHTARPWMGRNAIHRLGEVLRRLEAYAERRPVLDGCEYREAVQAVAVGGGVAGNVVPDLATVTVNHRFAPDRTPAAAEAHLREVVGDVDRFEVLDVADGAPPGLEHPLLRALIDRSGLEVRAKLGWTDVARFAAQGIPAVNFGPGDPTVAHMREERVERAALESTAAALRDLVRRGAS